VIWNNLLGELWRYTTVYLPRKLAKLAGMTHAPARADPGLLREGVGVSAARPGAPASHDPPGQADAEVPRRRDLPAGPAVHKRAGRSSVSGDRGGGQREDPQRARRRHDQLGSQLDVQQVSTEDEERRRRASYRAKHTTKSTEQAGGLLHRMDLSEVEHVARAREHRELAREASTTSTTADERANRRDRRSSQRPAL